MAASIGPVSSLGEATWHSSARSICSSSSNSGLAPNHIGSRMRHVSHAPATCRNHSQALPPGSELQRGKRKQPAAARRGAIGSARDELRAHRGPIHGCIAASGGPLRSRGTPLRRCSLPLLTRWSGLSARALPRRPATPSAGRGFCASGSQRAGGFSASWGGEEGTPEEESASRTGDQSGEAPTPPDQSGGGEETRWGPRWLAGESFPTWPAMVRYRIEMEKILGEGAFEGGKLADLLLDASRHVASDGAAAKDFEQDKMLVAVSALAARTFPRLIGLEFYDADGRRLTDEQLSKARLLSHTQRVDWLLERELLARLFPGSPFRVAIVEPQEALDLSGAVLLLPEKLFLGDFEGGPAADAAAVGRELSARLAAEFPDLFLCVHGNGGAPYGEWGATSCVIVMDRDSCIRMAAGKRWRAALWTLVAVAALGVQVRDASLYGGVESVVAGGLIPLGLLFVMGCTAAAQQAVSAAYRLPTPPCTVPLPVPGLGTIGLFLQPRCVLPNRACQVDLAIGSSLASAAASLLLLAAARLPLPAAARAAADLGAAFGIDGPGGGATPLAAIVPAGLFHHSAVLSHLAGEFSVALVAGGSGAGAGGGADVTAISPLALSGLLGLNMTALMLLPYSALHGGQIVGGLFKLFLPEFCHSWVQDAVSLLVLILLLPRAAAAPFEGPLFASLLVAALFLGTRYDVQRDMYTPPGAARTVLGTALLLAASVALLPDWLYAFVFRSGPGALIAQLGFFAAS